MDRATAALSERGCNCPKPAEAALDFPPNDAHMFTRRCDMARMARLKTEPPALAPIEPQTFSREADRERLSEVAIKAFLALMKAWGLSNAESAGLLGVSASSLDRIKRGHRPALEPGPADPGLGAGRDLQRAASSLRRRRGRRVDPQGQPRRPVRPKDADRGDDRGRHPADARRPPLCRRRARRPVISTPHSEAPRVSGASKNAPVGAAVRVASGTSFETRLRRSSGRGAG